MAPVPEGPEGPPVTSDPDFVSGRKAEAKRLHISKWFYDCPVEFYVQMASIWVNDPRFTKNIDKARPGLATYSYTAVQALAAHAEQ